MIARNLLLAGAAFAAVYACSTAPSNRLSFDQSADRYARSDAARGYSHFLVGRFASLSNDPARAAEHYAKALRASPQDRDLAERAVFTALMAGDFQSAAEISEDLQAVDGTPASLIDLVRGVDAMRRQRYARAATILEDVQQAPFNHMVADHTAAWALLDTLGLQAAEAKLMEARAGDALLDGVTLNMVGFLRLAAEDDAGAMEAFESVWTEGARLAVAAEAYGELLAAAGRTSEAVAVLTEFNKEVGFNPAVARLIQRIEAGDVVVPTRPSVRSGAALSIYAPAAALAAQTGDDIAGAYFALALALDPELHVARTLWADTLDDANRRVEAIDLLDAVPETSPFFATAQGQLAWALRREGRSEEALATAARALESTQDRNLKVQLGDLMRSVGRHGEAEAVFDEVIRADAATGRLDWRILFARGAARERTGNWQGAEEDLRASLAIEPDSPGVLNYLGYGLVERGEKLDEALALLRRAVDRRPDSGAIVDSLGWAYFKLGRYSEAVLYLERAVEMEPGSSELNDHLGDAYWRVGRTLEARFQWRRAVTLETAANDIQRIEAKLAQGLPVADGHSVAGMPPAASPQ